ncbi:hypothetical protein JW756_06090 [Candidatus Woesearchaeota archaeon]|nr:hypothetical protein [Candidatus Woesearchaeota archaeon]
MEEKDEKKTLEILIGDDLFDNPSSLYLFERVYGLKLKEGLREYDVRLTLETMPARMIAEAAKYDVVVTDLDYTGDGSGKQGYEVIDSVCKLNPRPLLILCTSCDDQKEISERTQGKIDYHAGTGVDHKFNQLIDFLIAHYKK